MELKKKLIDLGKIVETLVEFEFESPIFINADESINLPQVAINSPLYIPKKGEPIYVEEMFERALSKKEKKLFGECYNEEDDFLAFDTQFYVQVIYHDYTRIDGGVQHKITIILDTEKKL